MDVIFTNLPLAPQDVTWPLSVLRLTMTFWQRSNVFFRSDIFGGLSTNCLLSPSASDPLATHRVRLAEVLRLALVLQEESPWQGINGLLFRQSWSMLLQGLTPQLTARRTTLNFLEIYVHVANVMDAFFVFPPEHPMLCLPYVSVSDHCLNTIWTPSDYSDFLLQSHHL